MTLSGTLMRSCNERNSPVRFSKQAGYHIVGKQADAGRSLPTLPPQGCSEQDLLLHCPSALRGKKAPYLNESSCASVAHSKRWI